MPKDAVFECSVVCISVIIELLPGLIPFRGRPFDIQGGGPGLFSKKKSCLWFCKKKITWL